jgi:hypothetical protein
LHFPLFDPLFRLQFLPPHGILALRQFEGALQHREPSLLDWQPGLSNFSFAS